MKEGRKAVYELHWLIGLAAVYSIIIIILIVEVVRFLFDT